MLDHLSVGVADLERARSFYDAVLAPLGYGRVNDLESSSGYGPDRAHDDFCVVNLLVIALSAIGLAVGGYFPGILTSPIVGVAGAVLVRRLWRLTAAEGSG